MIIRRQKRRRVSSVIFAPPRDGHQGGRHKLKNRRRGPSGGKPPVDWSKAEGLWNKATFQAIGDACGCSRQAARYQYLRRQNNPDICEEFARMQARALMRRVG